MFFKVYADNDTTRFISSRFIVTITIIGDKVTFDMSNGYQITCKAEVAKPILEHMVIA